MREKTAWIRDIVVRFAAVSLAAATLIAFASRPAGAQTEGDLRQVLEGKEVRVSIDLPASQDGVNVYPRRKPRFDYNDHSKDLRRQGVGVPNGTTCRVTLIKVKDKHIEFQLNGGGPALRSRPGLIPPLPGAREAELALSQALSEQDKAELERLRRAREEEKVRLQQQHEADLEKWRRSGGSRINLRYDTKLTAGELTPESVREALSDFVEFEPSSGTAADPPAGRRLDEQEKFTKGLVTMITGELAGSPTIGAGIIFGTGPDRIYVVTANHVVRQGADQIHQLQVGFQWLPGEWVEGRLLGTADPVLDIAVLSVSNLQAIGVPQGLSFRRLGDVSALRARNSVYFVGYGSGQAWHTRQAPDPISAVSPDAIRFQSAFLTPGDSGGALVNEEWRIIGMIRSDQPPEGDALNISRILQKLREWNYPVQLVER